MPKTAAKPTIGIDIDELLFPMATSLMTYHNSEYGTSFSLDQMTSYFLEDLTGETEEQMMTKIEAFLKTEHYTLGQPVQGSIKAIRSLKQRFNLALITSRDAFFRGATEKFLEDHFGGLYDELYYTHTKEAPNVRIPKYVICQEISAIAMVDDMLKNVAGCAEHNIPGVLFGNYPWNQAETLPAGVTRVKDWAGVLEYFDGK